MRGLKLIMWSQGQWEASKKIALKGDKQVDNDEDDNTRTSRLLDQLGPEGRVSENTKYWIILGIEIIRIPNTNTTIRSNYSNSIWIPNYSSHPDIIPCVDEFICQHPMQS